MKFCEKCDNMFYIRVSEDSEEDKKEAGDSLVYYCRNCGNNESNVIESICVSKIQIKRTDQNPPTNENKIHSNKSLTVAIRCPIFNGDRLYWM